MLLVYVVDSIWSSKARRDNVKAVNRSWINILMLKNPVTDLVD